MRLLGSRPTGTRSSTSTSGVIDLAALRFTSELFPDQALPAAGLPWFMTVFGRDSLITSYQALPFTPELAETTLRVLARYQGTKVDPFRDELPGRTCTRSASAS
jgi:glycogen debranching enzyme